MPSRYLSTAALLILIAGAASAQTFDASANGTLKGDYFIREVLIAGQNTNGTITSASSATGIATFDGKGNYTFNGQSTSSASLGTVKTQTFTGTYQASPNGIFYLQSFITLNYCYGGVSAIGPNAFIASDTEGTNVDILVGIPAGSGASNATLQGIYTGGFIDYPNADVTMVRQATFNATADGKGGLGAVSVNGTAFNLGGSSTTQSVSNVTYTLAGTGSGSVNFGTASTSQLISGTKNLYVSADGGIVLGGNPAGFDLLVALRGLTTPATNATSSGLYFMGGFEDIVTPPATGSTQSTHAVDAFYGSINSNGAGTSISHNRIQSFAYNVYDYTYDSEYAVQPNGTFNDGSFYNYQLGAGGNAFIATGAPGYYSLLVGFGAPKYSGTGVYLNPVGIVNAANFAPITNPIAPNELVTIFGSGLAGSTATASALPLPTSLGGVQVTVNGTAAPLFYVTPGQIAFVVPQLVSPFYKIPFATIQVTNNNVKSNTSTVYTSLTAPGLFSATGNGINAALAQHAADFTLINSARPAKIGENIVLYASGLGSVSPAVADGAASPSNPVSAITDTDALQVGSATENITFAGLTPGLAGLYQVNGQLVQGTPTGSQYVFLSTQDGTTSETTLAISGSTTSSSVVTLDHAAARPHPQVNSLQQSKREGLKDRGPVRQTETRRW